MQLTHPLHGLIAATHTPFHADGSLNPAAIEAQALGYMAAAKAAMGFLGVNVGPARLPNANLTLEQTRPDLEVMGFFNWVR